MFAFGDETSAFEMRDTLARLQKQHLIVLEDAAVVVRKQDGKVKQAVSLVGTGALGGAFWGMLIGLLFLAPWLGLPSERRLAPWGARWATMAWTTSSSKRWAAPSSRDTRPCSCWCGTSRPTRCWTR